MKAEGRKAWCNACEGRPREEDWGCVQTLGAWEKEGLVTCDHRENQRKESTTQHVQNEPEERRGQNGAYYTRMRKEKSAVMFKKMEGGVLTKATWDLPCQLCHWHCLIEASRESHKWWLCDHGHCNYCKCNLFTKCTHQQSSDYVAMAEISKWF